MNTIHLALRNDALVSIAATAMTTDRIRRQPTAPGSIAAERHNLRLAQERKRHVLNYYPLLWPVLRRVDPERTHRLAIRALQRGLVPAAPPPADPALAIKLWGLQFPNPIGLAAGFDKNAEAVDGLLALGFGFVEVGTVTLRPQAGNTPPRLFRLHEDHALINRMGFNNDGAAAVSRRLARRRDQGRPGIVGANVGPNRDCLDPAGDCAAAILALAPHVDYVVINVSSPNTPGLRDLQRSRALNVLLRRALDARARANAKAPLLVKIAPDLGQMEVEEIAEVALELRLDGVIATNTTVARAPGLRGHYRGEAGGLSGQPLFEPSTQLLAMVFRATGGTVPLVGVGGIGTGSDAYAKVQSGATLLQVYTGLIYEGPHLIAKLATELLQYLRRDGFDRLTAAVGADHRDPARTAPVPPSGGGPTAAGDRSR